MASTTNMKTIKLKFFKHPEETHVSQILAGYKLLENGGGIQIKVISSHHNFRELGEYEHNAIVEAEVDGVIIAYDMGDGYQSIHRKHIFDKQLKRVSFYFKRSYDPSFHEGTESKNKVYPLGLNYYCTCKENPYDRFEWHSISPREVRRYISYLRGERKWLKLCDYKHFVSTNHYSEYKLLFLTRLWDSSGITIEHILKHYPYLSRDEAKTIVRQWKESLDTATEYRIKLIRSLRKEFGENIFCGGVSRDEFSEKRCPDLIADSIYTNKKNFMQLCRENYICITSEGLHKSIGWKLAEYVCNGRAIITEPLYFAIIGDFEEDKNYLAYSSVDECVDECHHLLSDIDLVHHMEKANADYYRAHLAPDVLIERTLKIAGIL